MGLLSLHSETACGAFTLPHIPSQFFGILDHSIYTMAAQLHIAAAASAQWQQLHL